MSPTPAKSTATPEELVRCTRLMTAATARAVAAGSAAGAGSQDQLTAAANLGRKTVVDMMVAAKVNDLGSCPARRTTIYYAKY